MSGYNLADIAYEDWDQALDDFTECQAELPNVTWDEWYEEQIYFANESAGGSLDQQFDHDINNFLNQLEEDRELYDDNDWDDDQDYTSCTY